MTPCFSALLTISSVYFRYLTKKQVHEGILELNFMEKKGSFGLTQIPLRTLCSKHYYAPSTLNQAPAVQPRIATVDSSNQWNGFRAQLIKNDLVRGTVHVNSECTSVGLIQDMLSTYKTYFIGIDNLMHLAKYDPPKLVQYITPEVLGTLKIATICHRTRSGSGKSAPSSAPSTGLKRRNRASMAMSSVDVQALATLEKTFMETEPDPEDRYLLLGLWRQLLSCSSQAIRSRLVACGLFKIISAILSYSEDPELCVHFLEGLKYMFDLPDSVKTITKKRKNGGINILQRLIDIISQGASTPTHAQVVSRAMDTMYYLDEPSAVAAMIDFGLIPALVKISGDSSAFLALRTKALELFRIFPASARKSVLASGILKNFSELIASTSTRPTHHSFLSHVLAFLAYLTKEDPANISSDQIMQNLVALVASKQSTTQNKKAAIEILTLAMGPYAAQLVDYGLPVHLISILLDKEESMLLRDLILQFFALPAFEQPETFAKLVERGLIRIMLGLLSKSTVEAESALARKFLRHPALTKEIIITNGFVDALETFLEYSFISDRASYGDKDVLKQNAELLCQLASSVGRHAEIQKSTLPNKLGELFKHEPTTTTSAMQYILQIDPDFNLFVEISPYGASNTGLEFVLPLVSVIDDEAFYTNKLHHYLFVLSLCQIPLSSSFQTQLDTRKGWIEHISKDILFSTMQICGQIDLANAKRVITMLGDLETGFGHVNFIFRMLEELNETSTLFGLILSKLSTFEAYLEFINHPGLIDAMLVPPTNPKASVFYELVKTEMAKFPPLRTRLTDPLVVQLLVSYLPMCIQLLKENPTNTTTAHNNAKAVLDFASTFLSSLPNLEDIISGTGATNLLQLISEPAAGKSVNLWAMGYLQKIIPKLSASECRELGMYSTLWNVVDSCDLSVEQSEGDSVSSFPTQVSIAAWKVLCTIPEHLAWLNALLAFPKTVTSWFFSSQSEFQMMALTIMEPARWQTVNCSSKQEFDAWRLKLNRGRIAHCSSQKDTEKLEVTKLARSFANNRVIEEDLSWISDESAMQQSLKDYLEIDELLRPKNSSDQVKEYSTLIEWIKFLRVCKNENVKQRFIPLLDTFHDSLFFLPDTSKSASAEEPAVYYELDEKKAELIAKQIRLKKSLARSASKPLSALQSKKIERGNAQDLVSALRSKLARASSVGTVGAKRGVSSAIPKAPPAPGRAIPKAHPSSSSSTATVTATTKWKPNIPAHYQLLNSANWFLLAQNMRFFPGAAVMPQKHFFELCYDSTQHGFKLTELRKRTSGLDRMLLLFQVAPKHADSSVGPSSVFGYFVSDQLRSPTSVSAPNISGGSTFMCWKRLDLTGTNPHKGTFFKDQSVAGGYHFDSGQSSLTLYKSVAAVPNYSCKIYFDTQTVDFPIHNSDKWAKEGWGSIPKNMSNVPLVHVQAFRVQQMLNNPTMTFNVRPGFGPMKTDFADNNNNNNGSDNDDKADDSGAVDLTQIFDLDEKIKALDEIMRKQDEGTEFEIESDSEEEEPRGTEEDEDLSPQDSESFMNRYLAKALNGTISAHKAKISRNRPGLQQSSSTASQKPTWVRFFRYSARSQDDYSEVDIRQHFIKLGEKGKSVVGIVKMKRRKEAEGEEPPVFGFYLNRGLSNSTSNDFVFDPFAMLFTLRGPQTKTPTFLPINTSGESNAYRFVANDTIQFGIGTDLMLNFNDHDESFSNLGLTYRLPKDLSFMSREAHTLFTDQPATTWEFEDIELYYATTAKLSQNMPTPSIGHMLRLLGQKDVLLLNQIRWRLKYLMLSGSVENKKQILQEIRRAQLADMKSATLKPEHSLSKRIEHPGVDSLQLLPVSVNGQLLQKDQIESLKNVLFNPDTQSFVADQAHVPLDITFAVLPSSYEITVSGPSQNTVITAENVSSLTIEQIESIPIEAIPYLTHVIVAAKKEASAVAERAKTAVVFASDTLIPPSIYSEAFPVARTYVDDYMKIIVANGRDHLRWYEQNAPTSLDPSRNFHIGPLLLPAERKLAESDNGLVSQSEDKFWKFLDTDPDGGGAKARPVQVPSRQVFVEDYQLDLQRIETDPIGLVNLGDKEQVGHATLSAAVRARFVTLRFLPQSTNATSKPVYFSMVKFLGYLPENNHYLVPPKPEAISDVIPFYANNMISSGGKSYRIDFGTVATAGIISHLREEVHKGDKETFTTEFMLRFSHRLFDQANMKAEQMYMGEAPTTFFWGGTAPPTWFTWRFTRCSVSPNAFMLRHGYNKNNSFIQNFVFQGTNDEPGPGMQWIDIEAYPTHYHTHAGHAMVFTLTNPPVNQFFNTFRILQKGNYYMGPALPGSPFMCISEFEIFGEVLLNDNATTEVQVKKTPTQAEVDTALGLTFSYEPPLSPVVSLL